MLTSTQKDLAEALSYVPLEEDEGDQQYPADVTYDPQTAPRASQKANAVMKDKYGILLLYWVPEGGNYTSEDKAALTGWYEIPSQSEIEDWLFDNSPCSTPNSDPVEPDHPDSWLKRLALV